MDTILDLGIKLIVAFQSLGDWLSTPMKVFSFLGSEEFYLVIMPLLYWCVDPALGARAGALSMLSGSIKDFFKLVFHAPRPYWYSTQVRAFSTETSFGIPSGHAQIAISIWGGVAAKLKKRWFWITAGVVIFLISISRLYLGVHFPSDVVVGWLIGLLLLWVYLKCERPIVDWAKRLSLPLQVLVTFGASVVLILFGVVARASLAGWELPVVWVNNAAAASPGAEAINPLSITWAFTNGGLLLGLILGLILLYRAGWFDARGSVGQQVLRFLLGLVGVLLFWRGLDMVFPDGETFLPLCLRYLRYGLVGFWVSFGAPQVFIRLKLARKPGTS